MSDCASLETVALRAGTHPWIEISPELLPELEVAVYWLIISVPIATLSGVLIGALQGSSRFWELNVISVLGATMVQVFPLIAAYSISPSLEVILPTAVSARLVVLVILFLACRTHVFRSYRPRFSKPLATGLLSFGGWVTVTSIVGPLMTMLDRFVIGAMLGAKGVTYYTIPYQLAERTVILPTSLAQALFPRFAVATTEEDRALLRKGIHAVTGLTTLPYVIGFFCIEPFIDWWISPEFGAQVGPVGQIVLFGFWANGFTQIIGARLQARGRPDLVAINHLCQLPAYLAALYAGLTLFGLPGAAVATSLRMFADGLVLAWLSRSLLEVARTLAVPLILLSSAFAASIAFDSRAILWQSFILIAILTVIWSVKHSPFSLPRISLRNRTRPEYSCSAPLMHQDKSEIGDHRKESSWPEEDLEPVPNCPICGSDSFQLLHDGLVDCLFFVAAGSWRLQRCDGCRCAYLNPRPTRDSIHRAYETYYTHGSTRPKRADTTSLSAFRRLRRAISNGYINNRFGANRLDAIRWGRLAAILFPRQRALLNGEFRHLPNRPSGERRLLDIGCGNGDFLVTAKDIGWTEIGIDMDAKAVAVAKSQGCNAEVGTVDTEVVPLRWTAWQRS